MRKIQDENKIVLISELCQDLMSSNAAYSNKQDKAFFDYDKVIESLKKAKEVMDESVRCPRPEELPDDMVWSEKFYDGEQEPDPFVYDGSMSIEDFQRWQGLVLEEEELEP